MNNSFRDLVVWQKAMDLVVLIYAITESYPKQEMYGIIMQMRRCSMSIPFNIAEGRRRGTRKEFHQFLQIAYGSGGELETQLEISKRLRFCSEEQYQEALNLLNEVMRMLNAMLGKM